MGSAFRFRLETVLRVRRLEEDRAKEVLAHATREVARRATAARSAASACESLPTVLEAMDADAFNAFRQRAAALAERAATASAALESAVVEHELARLEAVTARQRVATLERLSDRRFKEWIDERERAEVRAVDDVVSARSAAQRMDDASVG